MYGQAGLKETIRRQKKALTNIELYNLLERLERGSTTKEHAQEMIRQHINNSERVWIGWLVFCLLVYGGTISLLIYYLRECV
jgi:hypothetical protein